MAAKVWLLVEWVEESNVFPSYGMVNVDTLAYNETDLHPENEIFICVNHENPRRAKILRISESKRYIQEQKDILERQDQQVKNVLQICMRTIRDVQSNNMMPCGVQYNMPHVITASNANSASGSASDSEPEPNRQLERSIMQSINKSRSQYPKYGRKAPKIQPVRGTLNTAQTRRMISSTPLPGNSAQLNVTLCFDQGTQTEPIPLRPSLRKVEEIEAVLKGLYSRFQSLVAHVNICNVSSNGPIGLSDSEQNHDVSYVEPNNAELRTERNNIDYEDHGNVSGHVQDVGVEAVIVENGGNQSLNTSNLKVEDRINPNALQVRRMSAQTTNNIETPSIDADLVSIGNGNTKVPARLLNDINWNSHTTATRQLLQAVFPRRVLATHSLTGKQSPAFMNRPPKKILDPKLVEDIVKIVSTRCGVPKNLVRNSITIKCTDEAKLYRNRLQYKLQRQINGNEENRPPSIPSSDESSNTVMN